MKIYYYKKLCKLRLHAYKLPIWHQSQIFRFFLIFLIEKVTLNRNANFQLHESSFQKVMCKKPRKKLPLITSLPPPLNSIPLVLSYYILNPIPRVSEWVVKIGVILKSNSNQFLTWMYCLRKYIRNYFFL